MGCILSLTSLILLRTSSSTQYLDVEVIPSWWLDNDTSYDNLSIRLNNSYSYWGCEKFNLYN